MFAQMLTSVIPTPTSAPPTRCVPTLMAATTVNVMMDIMGQATTVMTTMSVTMHIRATLAQNVQILPGLTYVNVMLATKVMVFNVFT